MHGAGGSAPEGKSNGNFRHGGRTKEAISAYATSMNLPVSCVISNNCGFGLVRYRGQSGKYLLALSFSGFDPNSDMARVSRPWIGPVSAPLPESQFLPIRSPESEV
jgi:hypothetical protein